MQGDINDIVQDLELFKCKAVLAADYSNGDFWKMVLNFPFAVIIKRMLFSSYVGCNDIVGLMALL